MASRLGLNIFKMAVLVSQAGQVYDNNRNIFFLKTKKATPITKTIFSAYKGLVEELIVFVVALNRKRN